ncbi:MAG: sigma-70 family RNA polymerase sigma factor [Planctomycetota bacterium]|nr:MAG: sigma-70 family RNA polymerase sigma factor [Planctomycetota bacterium]
MKTTELAAKALGPAGESARAELVERVLERVRRSFYRLTGNPDDAEDLTQATLLLLQRSLVEARYRPGCSLNTWLFLKAHSVFVDWCRRRDLEARALPRVRPASSAPADPAEASARRLDGETLLARLAEELGPETYECFVLRYEAGLELEELARALGCSSRTVSRRLARAHRLLDQLCAEDDP